MDAYACQRCMVILPKPLAVTKQMSDHSFGAYILEEVELRSYQPLPAMKSARSKNRNKYLRVLLNFSRIRNLKHCFSS